MEDNVEKLMENLTISNVLIGVVTLLVLAVGYLVLLAPGKKEKEEALKEMAFDDMMDDKGWAEEEPDEKQSAAKAAAKAGAKPGAGGGAPGPMPGPGVQSMPQMPEITPNKHDPSLPFQIGDRVVLQKLVGAAALNGRHGIIAAPYDKKTQRYPVDLDLFHDKPLAVKEANLKKESPLLASPPPATDDMPNVVNGCMEPHHAKACGFIFHVLRKSCSQTLNGETNPHKLAAFGWQFWNQTSAGAGVYPSLLQYLTADILKTQKLTDLDKQVSPDVNNPTKGAYALVTKAMKSKQAVGAWNVRVEGAFWIVGMGPQGTMVVPAHNTRQVYIVAGFQAPLMAVAGGGQNKFPRPPKFHLTLLPWFGVLVHDSFLSTTTGSNQVELASPQLAQELIMNSKRAVAENRIITSLQQLNMDPPNLQGVPYQKPPAMNSNNMPPQDPPNAKEKELVTKLSKIKDVLPPPDGLWNFIRPPNAASGSSNNAPFVLLNAKGEKFSEFTPTSTKTEDLPAEILGCIVKMVEEKKEGGGKLERPAAIGVQDANTCQRLQFLCWNIPNLRVLQLNVKTQPQQQQAQEKKSKEEEAADVPAAE